ncbi:hypothetical protein [Tritonibacter horizontis]|uniref:Uncharacterized protein n=1 Tax=Tritonibacter horizontis TaxID=1768241 RepID=A0A132C185_9RHOB|nr:hypothetical protein [Tritonibacter horizontis]KUP93887.1 hypothetical protein TRIHO_12080 [Tritonibacter horizontis]
MSYLIVSLSCLSAVLLAPLLALAGAPAPMAGEPALVVAAPWSRAVDIARRAAVSEMITAEAPMGVLVIPEDAEDIHRLFDMGAWFVIDGKRIAELCAV